MEDRFRRVDILFDFEIEEKDYGLVRGEFRVYVSREEFVGFIRLMRGGDVEVRI